MKLFVVCDRAHLGRGAFGVFSTMDKAETFLLAYEREIGHHCAIRDLTVLGDAESEDTVFAAYLYNQFYDTFVLDGLYGKVLYALDAVGPKGLIIKFTVDSPAQKEIVVPTQNPFAGE